MSRETDGIIAVIAASGIEYAVTDINTKGAHASQGNHYKRDCTPSQPHPVDTQGGKVGRAVDFAQRRYDGKRDSPGLFAIYRFFLENYGRQLQELYYSGPGADYCVRNGLVQYWTDVPAGTRTAIRAGHHNHVHVAVPRGVFLVPIVQQVQESVQEVGELPAYADKCEWKDGAVAYVYADGAVYCPEGGKATAKSYGAIGDLASQYRRGFHTAVAIKCFDVNDSQAGYVVLNQKWQKFEFVPGVEKLFGK